MFCHKCGKQIDDDALFCEHCGVSVCDDQEVTNTTATNPISRSTKNPNKKKVWITIAVLLGIFILFGSMGEESTDVEPAQNDIIIQPPDKKNTDDDSSQGGSSYDSDPPFVDIQTPKPGKTTSDPLSKPDCRYCQGSGWKTCTSCHGQGYTIEYESGQSLGYGPLTYEVKKGCMVCSRSGRVKCYH